MKRFVHMINYEGGEMVALQSLDPEKFYIPQDSYVLHEDARAVIDGLQALLNQRDAEIDLLKAESALFENAAHELREGLKDVLGWIESSQSTSALRGVVERAIKAADQ